MIRLLLYLFGKKDFEDCKSCETLKVQLDIANQEKKELTNTLIGILKPTIHEATSQEIKPLQQTAVLFSRRKQVMEEAARQRAATLNKNPLAVIPESLTANTVNRLNSTEELEQELDIPLEDKGEKSNG